MLRRSRGAILSCMLILTLVSCSDEPPRLKLDRARLRVKGKAINAELARGPEEQARGLMYRRSLGENEGMLFVYDSPRMVSFWMKNTRIPLSIAFMDGSGRVVQIERMQPYDCVTLHPSLQPVQYALEVNLGWFEKNGVGVGDMVEIPNPKSQIPNRENQIPKTKAQSPNPRDQRSKPRAQISKRRMHSMLCWDLGFGIWDSPEG